MLDELDRELERRGHRLVRYADDCNIYVRSLKRRIRQLARRTRGVSIEQMVEKLSRYRYGWRGYYGYCETRSTLEDLDKWIRRRLRAVIWKRGRRRYAGLREHGVRGSLAAKTAGSSHGLWRIARSPALNYVFPNAYWDSLGLPRLTARKRA